MARFDQSLAQYQKAALNGYREVADSLVTNQHKWLMTNFDCSCYFVRDVPALEVVRELEKRGMKINRRVE